MVSFPNRQFRQKALPNVQSLISGASELFLVKCDDLAPASV